MTTPMDERRLAFLQEIGIGPVWQRRDLPAAPVTRVEEAVVAEVRQADAEFDVPPIDMSEPFFSEDSLVLDDGMEHDDVAGMDWQQLKNTVANCTKCGLCRGRTNTVFGVGDEKAKWLFIGEGPGRNEDLKGEPFVGPAGKLLDNMLLAMGLKRGDNAYIANIVKCRPTDESGRDRPPTPAEAAACLPYLRRQIELIQPTVLVALGKTAAISLMGLDAETPVSKLRGTVHRYAGKPLVVTYHPAYLLRNLVDKKKTWTDLCLAMATYAGAD
ncbi:MAG TPA: uracil-DNA glycosylase [Noviherbaspirillum sp.]|nr:uracil-DNA glycosylase [Noviherbaspirillum sp.]